MSSRQLRTPRAPAPFWRSALRAHARRSGGALRARAGASFPTVLAAVLFAAPRPALAQGGLPTRGQLEESSSVPTGFVVAAAGGYGFRLGGDLALAEPPGGDSGPGAEVVGRHRFRDGLAPGVGIQHAWLALDGPVGDATLLRLFGEIGYVLEIDGFPLAPVVGSRLGLAVESRSSPEFTGTRRAEGLDVGGFLGARFPLSERVAVEAVGAVSFLVLDRTEGTGDRSGQIFVVQAGLEVALE